MTPPSAPSTAGDLHGFRKRKSIVAADLKYSGFVVQTIADIERDATYFAKLDPLGDDINLGHSPSRAFENPSRAETNS